MSSFLLIPSYLGICGMADMLHSPLCHRNNVNDWGAWAVMLSHALTEMSIGCRGGGDAFRNPIPHKIDEGRKIESVKK